MIDEHGQLVFYGQSRRRFMQGLAAGAALFCMPRLSFGTGATTVTGSPRELSGTEFELSIAETPVNFSGRVRMATTINGSLPAPTLRWRQGDLVTIRVSNRLQVPTSIHWHGILLPFEMDGVPGISFNGIAPGSSFAYRFRVNQTGTYWYHSHSGMQEQTGMYGAIIIDPPVVNQPAAATAEHVLLFSDWTDEDPMRVLAKLKAMPHYYNFNQPAMGDFLKDVRENGIAGALEKRQMWNQMRMSPTDLADVSGATYTYLLNGCPPAACWSGLFRPGEELRLRCINGSAQTFFDLRIPGLKLKVVQTDGQDVEPVTVDELRIGVAETYDLLVTPREGAYTVFAQAMDRSGFACGTLTEQYGLHSAIPTLEQPEWLTMTDMMGVMDHGAHGAHAGHQAQPGHGEHATHAAGLNLAKPSRQVRHAWTEFGPSVDMRVDQPRTNLDDPGIGLRTNGRRVLTYADLHTIGGPLDQRLPSREMELHLTGNMHRYSWSIDGVEYRHARPLRFRLGERLRVILHNDTMMTHPMHLHGMWSELEDAEGRFVARKHTVVVQPAQRISILVTADAPGRWAFHCHLLYHMDAGMFREVVVV